MSKVPTSRFTANQPVNNPPSNTNPSYNIASEPSIDVNENVIRILPERFVHILDTNLNITRLQVGPQTLVRKEHEKLVCGPEKMIILPSQTYCQIANPVVRDKEGNPRYSGFKQVLVKFGDVEYRISDDYQNPFPLYPGEILSGGIEDLIVVPRYSAIRLRANRELEDVQEQKYAGEEWQIEGPLVYIPRVEVDVLEVISPTIITVNTGLHLRALKDCTDSSGEQRKAGEEWIQRQMGSYLPTPKEFVVQFSKGIILTETNGIQLKATQTFTDVYGIKRFAGQEWLITRKESQIHIPDVYEEVLKEVQAISLNSLQYCVLLNPYDLQTFRNQWGLKKLIRGETMIFLYPGESLENGIQDVQILGDNQALLLQAIESFVDDKQERKSGERWMIHGPREYVPPVEVRILENRVAIPLDDNEGIYVKNINSGEVYAISGQTYMLGANQELWEKELSGEVETLLKSSRSGIPYIPPKIDERGNLSYNVSVDESYVRDKTRIVTYKASHNSAVQIYDYKNKIGRIVFGPDLIKLGPYEEFTIVRLSGGRPKRENVIQNLSLSLGPDFMSDEIVVETSDHARLNVKLSYNWHFQVDQTDKEDCAQIFNVQDFVGDVCQSIASRVRGAVSQISFEDFHNHSSTKIREAVFGKKQEDNSLRESLKFDANNLVITSVDIQGQEIIDVKTRGFLSESIHMAIQISTKTQEDAAQHEADKVDAVNRGKLEKEKLEYDSRIEEENIKLLQIRKKNDEINELGLATAEAYAEAKSLEIKGDSLIQTSQLKAQASRTEFENELETIKKEKSRFLELERKQVEFLLHQTKAMAQIEKTKFTEIIKAIGKETIVQIASAGPDMQARLLKGLGLQGFLISDGQNPINLFNTANGFLGSKSN